MSSCVLLVGAGQLGSRYLQGLKLVSAASQVHVVEGDSGAVERAKARWAEIPSSGSVPAVAWHASMAGIPASVDLAIIATPADVRADVLDAVRTSASVRYWILEKVLVQSVDDLPRLRAVTAESEGVWVNTPRRAMPLYRHLASLLKGMGPLDATLRGGSWGLACNSVHYLDLVTWLTGERLLELDVSGLSGRWHPSKRRGFFETDGTMVARFAGGSHLTLVADASCVGHVISFRSSDGIMWEVDELTGTASGPGVMSSGGGVLLQSALTPLVAGEILQRGTCPLPTLDESIGVHEVFLSAMLANWNATQSRADVRLPIT